MRVYDVQCTTYSVRVRVYVCVCLCTCVYVCVCVCEYVYKQAKMSSIIECLQLFRLYTIYMSKIS